MRVTYIGHSGFSVELESHILLFDYYEGTMPEFDPAKKLLVFASHSHPDHFNREILKLADVYPDVEYIFPKDIRIAKKEQRESEHFMRKRDEITVGDTKVKSLRSTDEGVAFLVRCEDRIIYHAGDLNWWHWEEEDDAYNRMMRGDYQKEIETLAGERSILHLSCLTRDRKSSFTGALTGICGIRIRRLYFRCICGSSTRCRTGLSEWKYQNHTGRRSCGSGKWDRYLNYKETIYESQYLYRWSGKR